ncbi:hypothetical protein [Weissella minor]|uniref:Uncharacterized protein n=1 Tax=Weissella minor TaxID=1620 RepID=A0A0R2JQU9_9LACO|nr:hypothetical protein [Weissella minor]KRN76938.1 hypothetical protein IV67_GL000448 [Weissella minor]
MSRDTIKNIIIAILAIALVGTGAYAVQAKQHVDKLQPQVNERITRMETGEYKVSSKSLKAKTAEIKDDQLIFDKKTTYYMVRGISKKNSKDNFVILQNVKNNNTNLYQLKSKDNKLDFYKIKNGKPGSLAFSLNK